MIGTIINAAAIIGAGLIGLALRQGIPGNINHTGQDVLDGVLTAGLGLDILEDTPIRVADLLPGILPVPRVMLLFQLSF